MSSNNSSSNCDQNQKEDESKQESESFIFNSSYTNQVSESNYGSLNNSNSGYSANISKSSNSSQGKSSSTYEETNKQKKPHKKFKYKIINDQSKLALDNGLYSDSGFHPSLSECDVSTQYHKENKAIKVAQLSQCLDIIGKLKKSYDAKNNQLKISNNITNDQGSFDVDQHLKNTLDLKSADLFENKSPPNDKDGFCVAISLHNGTIIHTTSSITSILGYPRDMWLGRSFMDFVFPKDRLKFNQQIASDVSNPIKQHISPSDMARKKSRKTSFFCRLRMYNGLRTGKFSVKERKTVFTPFKLIICFKEMETNNEENSVHSSYKSEKCIINPQLICLLATCIPLRTPYNHQYNLGPFNQQFITKHNSDCKFIQFSESAIPFLGYMPQDIENSDVFNFYHPHDLTYLRNIYEKVVKDRVKIVHSRPYRLKAYNGCYITVETDWSCFVNPWLKKLEFVVGKHKVIEGPLYIDVFASPKNENSVISHKEDEDEKDIIGTIQSIRQLLKETFTINTECSEQSTRRRKELASFMGTLLEEMAKVEHTEFPSNDHSSSTGASTMVLGNIGPQPNEFGSTSPPSYNQLNYNENLYRFFNSHPHTLSPNEAASINPNIKDQKSWSKQKIDINYHKQCERETKCQRSFLSIHRQHHKFKKKCQTESRCSGDLGAAIPKENKNETISGYSGSNSNSQTGSNSITSACRIIENVAPTLTEELLYEHNKGMEKQLLADFTNSKKTLVSFKKSVRLPKKHFKNRHRNYSLQKSIILNSESPRQMINKFNLHNSQIKIPFTQTNITSFLDIGKSSSQENTSSSFTDYQQEDDKVNENNIRLCENYNSDSLLNSLAIESLLDGLDNDFIRHKGDQAHQFKSPTKIKTLSRLGSHDTSTKVEPGSILESSNLKSLHSDFHTMLHAKNTFSEYSSSNSSSLISSPKSTDETMCLSQTSSYEYSFKINKGNIKTILKEDKNKLNALNQSSNLEKQFKDIYMAILKVEKSVRPLLDESHVSYSSSYISMKTDKKIIMSLFDLPLYLRCILLNEDQCPFPPVLDHQ